MKPSAILINTARGRLVDEAALIDALRQRTIAAAGIDVYVGEPPVTYDPHPNPEFFTLDNVVLTPHLGGCTEDALKGIATLSARNLVALVRGERPEGLLNPEVFATT